MKTTPTMEYECKRRDELRDYERYRLDTETPPYDNIIADV